MARGESSNNLESHVAIQVIESTLSAASDKLRNNPERKKQIKILGLNLGIAAADIITLKLGILGGGALGFAFGSTIFFLSAVGVIYGNYRLFAEPQRSIPMPPTPDKYIILLDKHRGIKTFEEDIDLAKNQIVRMQRKIKTIRDLIAQTFGGSEITCHKFIAVISELEKAFYMNIQIIINKLDTFDLDTFDGKDFISENGSGDVSQQIIEAKGKVRDKYVNSIKAATEENEQILLMLDNLLFGISEIEDGDRIPPDKIVEMIDRLLEDVKKYIK